MVEATSAGAFFVSGLDKILVIDLSPPSAFGTARVVELVDTHV
jgi:hypothetical protein